MGTALILNCHFLRILKLVLARIPKDQAVDMVDTWAVEGKFTESSVGATVIHRKSSATQTLHSDLFTNQKQQTSQTDALTLKNKQIQTEEYNSKSIFV